jgi:hypothetical protein
MNHLAKSSLKEQPQAFISVVDTYRKTLKVRDMAPDNKQFWTKTRATLAQCSLMLGSKIAPNDQEYFILKNVLIESFKDFSPQEILNAFNLLIAGKLNCEADKYGKISAAYLGKVLIAYRDHRHKALAEELKNKPKEEKQITKEERAKIRAEFLQNCLIKPYKEIEKNGAFEVDRHTATQLFKLFRRAGQIEVGEEEDEKYQLKAIADLKEEASKDRRGHKPMQTYFEAIRDMNLGKNDKMRAKIMQRACGLYFYDFILRLHKNNINIEKLAERL